MSESPRVNRLVMYKHGMALVTCGIRHFKH